MEKEYIHGKMEEYTKDNLKMIKNMVRVMLNILMEENTKENIKMIKNMVKVL